MLHNHPKIMKKAGIIESIKPGLFQLSDSYLSSPVSGYEVALAVMSEEYLSHLSSLTLYQLTNKLSNIIYVNTELRIDGLSLSSAV